MHPEAAIGRGLEVDMASCQADSFTKASQPGARSWWGRQRRRRVGWLVVDGHVDSVVEVVTPRRVTAACGACLRTLVSDSWTTR